ncbi:MAG: hypothetical protein Rubg2KO_19970 [Rubricoccaceae bacterium]
MAKSKGSKKKRSKKHKKAKKKRASATKAPKVPKSLRKGDLPTSVGEVLAAGLGALREAQSSGSKQFNALVTRGRAVQASGSEAARDAGRDVESAVDRALGTVRSAHEAVTGGVQDRVESAVEGVLLRLGVPTRDEIVALQATVDAMEAQLSGIGVASSSGVTRETVEVRKHTSGWAVYRGGAEAPAAVRSTKKQALFEARALARSHAPSELTVRKLDGTVGETTTYGD